MGPLRSGTFGRLADPTLAEPHILTANRYQRPRAAPGGADGRRTLTAEDPDRRLQSGTFCARCYAWTNDCYWRCDSCNDGDWGFCNDCVSQGRSCPHPLLPWAYQSAHSSTPPASPRSPGRPQSGRCAHRSECGPHRLVQSSLLHDDVRRVPQTRGSEREPLPLLRLYQHRRSGFQAWRLRDLPCVLRTARLEQADQRGERSRRLETMSPGTPHGC